MTFIDIITSIVDFYYATIDFVRTYPAFITWLLFCLVVVVVVEWSSN